ncbi:protein breaking of asymmetry in the stomatal lineage [Tanacetum coccineum]
MSTPYTMMRCRMKDLISCFNSCKLPIDDDDDDHHHHKQPKPSSKRNDPKRHKDKGQVEHERTAEKDVGDESPANWQSCESEEDEYIVFYFKDDNAGGGVVEERSSQSSSRQKQVVGAGRKKHETRKVPVDTKSVPLETEEFCVCGEHMDTQGESSDSSTSSFAFPTIHREWTGSPVLMPRPEGHKSRQLIVDIEAGFGRNCNGLLVLIFF